MSFRRLRYFVAAAEAQNFSRAAKRMNIAAPALSRQIHELESELGVLLFDRIGRRVSLSGAGKTYLGFAQEMLALIDRADEEMRRYTDERISKLLIGLQELASYQEPVLAAVWKFRRAVPECRIVLEPMPSATQHRAILDHALDAGFLYSWQSGYAGLAHINMSVDHWQIAMANNHRLAHAESVNIADLIDEDFVFFPETISPEIHTKLFAACAVGGLRPRIVHRAMTSMMLFGLVAAGAGVSFVCTPTRPPSSILMKPVRDLDLSMSLDLVWREDENRSTVLRFIEMASASL